jgi:hypothetical protein
MNTNNDRLSYPSGIQTPDPSWATGLGPCGRVVGRCSTDSAERVQRSPSSDWLHDRRRVRRRIARVGTQYTAVPLRRLERWIRSVSKARPGRWNLADLGAPSPHQRSVPVTSISNGSEAGTLADRRRIGCLREWRIERAPEIGQSQMHSDGVSMEHQGRSDGTATTWDTVTCVACASS